jgi:hypothetical protein
MVPIELSIPFPDFDPQIVLPQIASSFGFVHAKSDYPFHMGNTDRPIVVATQSEIRSIVAAPRYQEIKFFQHENSCISAGQPTEGCVYERIHFHDVYHVLIDAARIHEM